MNNFRVGDWGYTPWYIWMFTLTPKYYRRKLSYKNPKTRQWEYIWEYM